MRPVGIIMCAYLEDIIMGEVGPGLFISKSSHRLLILAFSAASNGTSCEHIYIWHVFARDNNYTHKFMKKNPARAFVILVTTEIPKRTFICF